MSTSCPHLSPPLCSLLPLSPPAATQVRIGTPGERHLVTKELTDFSSPSSKQFTAGERTLISVGFQKEVCGESVKKKQSFSTGTISFSWASSGNSPRGHDDLWHLAIPLHS